MGWRYHFSFSCNHIIVTLWGEFAEAEAYDAVSFHSRSSEESVVILLVGMDVAYYSPPLTDLVQCLFTDILLILLPEFYVSGKHPWDVGMSTYPSRNIRNAKQLPFYMKANKINMQSHYHQVLDFEVSQKDLVAQLSFITELIFYFSEVHRYVWQIHVS